MKATEEQKQYMKEYYQKNKIKRNKYRKELYYRNHKHELEIRRTYFNKTKKKRYEICQSWNKRRLIEVFKILGNKCCRCGYTNFIALEIHHKDGSHRKNRRCRDYLKLDYDLNRVELICSNCHQIEHYIRTKTVLK